jgi:hypothetical protein
VRPTELPLQSFFNMSNRLSKQQDNNLPMAANCGCVFLFHNIVFPTQKLYDKLQKWLEQNAPSWQQICLFRFLRNWPWVVKIATQSSGSQKWPYTATSHESFAPDTCSRRKVVYDVFMVVRITYLCRNNLTFEFKPTQAHSNTIQTTSYQPLAFGIVDSNYPSDSSVVKLPHI